ncbi:GntR family transcriptional regulator [Flexivirga alba]|uniref:GntR family transcriptional regulator n=1 Tax=Flexivirga alba TaxID=702742 RepID=A0ABW2AMG5_9MICO
MSEQPDGSKYARISAALRVQVEQLEPGAALPSERELAQQWAVARMTIRRALAELVNAGLVRTVHGSGSVRAPQPVSLRVQLGSFAAALRAHHLHPETEILDAGTDPEPPTAVRDFLGPGNGAICVRRLRRGDGVPLALERTWLRADLLTLEEARHLTGSLYDHLARDGRQPDGGEESVRADLPDAEEARALQLPATRPVFRLTRRARLAAQPVEYAEAVLPADRCELWFPLAP